MSLVGYNAGVLINICSEDGSVQVSQTGVEIGQGINTKVAQAVAYGLGMKDTSMIEVMSNRSEVIPNAGETGGSGTSESNVGAALAAAKVLTTALAPYAGAAIPWATTVANAFAAGVNLQASSTFLFTANAPAQNQFTYFVWAAACSTVELDVLSGEIQILNVDLVYDNGNSLNPAVDIGQIEGAFVQGLGFFFTGTRPSSPHCGLLVVLHPTGRSLVLWCGSAEDIITSQDKGVIINNGTTHHSPLLIVCSVCSATDDRRIVAGVWADRNVGLQAAEFDGHPASAER
jgi:xanthine dehydrogenase molybdopterin-binding subunit B